MKTIYYKILARFYKLIRPLFVEDIDPNEDFECIYCRRPSLDRILYCSDNCFKNHLAEVRSKEKRNEA